jgi:hypothetical protein
MFISLRRFLPRATVASAAIAASLTLAAPGAHAVIATFDFVALAAGNEGIFTSATNNGVTVTGSASGFANSVAYLDDLSGGLPAGLGVCSTGNGACAGTPDDNVTVGETLTLTFDRAVDTIQVFFRNQDHGTTFSGNFDLVIDGGSAQSFALAALFAPPVVLNGTSFDFSLSAGNTADAFYISKIEVNAPERDIPEPVSLALFGLGLAGLGLVRRRRSA